MEANLTKFNKFEAISNELTQKVIDITIKTPMDLITANALKKTIQENMKELEDMRTFIKKPFLDACTTIDNRGKELNFPFEEAKNALAKKLLTYEEEQEKKRMAEQKRINDIKIAISKLDTSEKIHAFDL